MFYSLICCYSFALYNAASWDKFFYHIISSIISRQIIFRNCIVTSKALVDQLCICANTLTWPVASVLLLLVGVLIC